MPGSQAGIATPPGKQRPRHFIARSEHHLLATASRLREEQSPTLIQLEIASMPKGRASRNDRFHRPRVAAHTMDELTMTELSWLSLLGDDAAGPTL
jgi:hypothetical protein